MIPADAATSCPECESGPITQPLLRRREFIRVLGAGTAAVALGGMTPLQRAFAARAAKQAEAEALVFELYQTMDAEQRKKLVRPWDAATNGGKGVPARLHVFTNAPVGKSVIGLEYDKKQVEILDKIFHSICNGEEGYRRMSRSGKFDNSGSFESIGALIYGEPVEGKKFALVFDGHHLTLRCDGRSEPQTAFGGPLYYGHSPNGYATTNVFNFQTKVVNEIFAALDDKQREIAVKPGKWVDGDASIKLPGKDARTAGLSIHDMTREQKELTEKAMRELVSPYRKEDGDLVMEIIRANGGMEKISLAFYREGTVSEKEPWTFWRLEGPGFVWSFRALPHIHTFVSISSRIA